MGRGPGPAADRRVGAGGDRARASSTRSPAARATGSRRRCCSRRSRQNKFDALFGGARRDEEKARAKERVFSFRDEFGQWDPKNQRPELWSLYNGRVQPGQSIRVFPLSNWTELDIWTYIAEDNVEIAPLYLAEERDVVERDGMLYAVNEFTPLKDGRDGRRARRSATGRSATRTSPRRSSPTPTRSRRSSTEIAAARITERGATRGDDKVSETSMEDRKREGYF